MDDRPLNSLDRYILANEVNDGETQVYWQNPTSGEFHRIIGVDPDPVDIDGDGVPVPVAHLESGHIDLENTLKEQFFLIDSLFKPPRVKTKNDEVTP